MNQLARTAQWIQQTPSLFEESSQVRNACPIAKLNLKWPEEYSGNPRLGFLYQHVVSELFSNSNQYNLLAEEIQLSENGRTLGAVDFIVEDLAEKQIEHWEVAIKFYLLHGELWYGPNAKDRLDLKLSRMLDHQLAMSSSKAFHSKFPEWSNATKNLLMQGRLYINPFENNTIPKTCLSKTINHSRIKGYWCFQNQQHMITEPLYEMKKHQWITGLERFENAIEPPAVDFSRHYQSESGQFWFIVPESWPEG